MAGLPIGALTLMLLLLAGCAAGTGRFESRIPYAEPAVEFTAPGTTNQMNPEWLRPSSNYFTLGPGDRLEIQILGRPATRGTVVVGPDGKIYYHLLPGLDVWGMTLDQARQSLEQGLGKYLEGQQVSVTLREAGSKYVWLLGRLNRPGIYPLTGPMTIIEAIALSGGTARSSSTFTTEDLADLKHSFVMRRGQLLPVDFYRLLREGDMQQNLMLEADDLVYIRSALAQEVYVLGAIRNPRAVTYSEHMSLVSAIAAVNGTVKFDYLLRNEGVFSPDADLSRVAIVRGSLTDPRIAQVDYRAIIKGRAPDVPLEPGDIVYVPNTVYRTLKSYLSMVVNTFVSTIAVNEGIRAGGGNVGVGVSVPVTPAK